MNESLLEGSLLNEWIAQPEAVKAHIRKYMKSLYSSRLKIVVTALSGSLLVGAVVAVGVFTGLFSFSQSTESFEGAQVEGASSTLDENCVISILNRNVRVKPDGS